MVSPAWSAHYCGRHGPRYLSLIGGYAVNWMLSTVWWLSRGIGLGAWKCRVPRRSREAEKRLKGDLLIALLQENLSPQDAQLWAQNNGVGPSEAPCCHALCLAGGPLPFTPSIANPDQWGNNPPGAEGDCQSDGLGDRLFLPVPRRVAPAGYCLQFAQAVLDQAGCEYTDTRVLCGLGTPSNDITEWPSSFRQAQRWNVPPFREQKPLSSRSIRVSLADPT